jgi:HlyD family secretion protein
MTNPHSAQVDLRELAVDRGPKGSALRRPRNWLTRYVIPAILLAGFAGLLGWSLRERWLPATPVTVVPVVATRAEVQAVDTPLFQAAGWVEPRPTPVIVSALVEGVVERLTVIEGQTVAANEPVAYLIDKDAKLAVRRGRADLDLRKAELAAAEAAQTAARQLLDDPIPRKAELAEAEAMLSKVETELASLPSMLEAARARRDFAERELESKKGAGDGVPAITIRRAESDLKVTASQIDELTRKQSALAREQDALTARRDVLQRQLALKIDEQRAADEAAANVAVAQAQIELAETALATAELALERMVVRAPIAGKILALTSRPGTKLMGLAPAAMADASTVVTMYDPASLQVRADVRLEDVPRVVVAQRARIETPAVKEPLLGTVITATSIADIQKNTLQVKVAIDQPPPVIKPDMLVQVTFLAPPQPAGAGQSQPAMRIAAPLALIEGSGESASVWIADLTRSRAERRAIQLGSPISPELVEVKSGLAIGDRLIAQGRETLTEGQRIRITQEDESIGK